MPYSFPSWSWVHTLLKPTLVTQCPVEQNLTANATVAASSIVAGRWFFNVAPKKLWLLSGSGFNSLSATKFAEDVPLRRNLTPIPGVNPGVRTLVKSVAPPNLIKPAVWPGLKRPVKGESEIKYLQT